MAKSMTEPIASGEALRELAEDIERLERFVALSRAGGVPVLVGCTKGDLARDPVAEAAE